MQSNIFFATILTVFVCFTTAFAQCVPPTNIIFKAISPSSSNGTTTNADGKLTLSGFIGNERFQVCEGSVFHAPSTLQSIQTLDITGIIQNDMPNPNTPTTYTVRVYDAVSDICFIDYTTTMYPTLVAEIQTGETFTLKAPDTLTTVQWFENGVPIVGATSSLFIANTPGRYTFSGTTPGGCTLPSCSPLELRNKGTLPVKLLFFNANVQICDVVLRWSTATELNAKSFEVYRSIDGINFTKIATLRAAGTTNTTQYYEYKDNAPFKTSYYKLIETDFDGTTETFNLAQRVVTNNCESNVSDGISTLYPNPNATDVVNVRFYSSRPAETVDFLIYDMLGREVSSTPTNINDGATLVNLSIADLPSGTYSVKVRGNGWYSLAQKFVRVR
jgi:Secretion system C-terminal sorting domain